MELIINSNQLIKTPRFIKYNQPKFVYISGISCTLKKTNETIRDIFFIIKKGNEIFNYLFEKEVVVDETCQIFIIKKDYYNEFGIPSFDENVINSSLSKFMFESISRVKNPVYMLISLVNYIGSDGFIQNTNNALEKIKTIISNNISDCEFNLDKLCNLIYMSRRKIQYILSSYHESFLKLLHSLRVERLKIEIDNTPNAFMPELIHSNGFKNHQTANRLFKQYTGMSIAQYKKSKNKYNQ